jgi:hypothetical protein
VALVNGGMTPTEIQNSFRTVFWKLTIGLSGITALAGLVVVTATKAVIRARSKA